MHFLILKSITKKGAWNMCDEYVELTFCEKVFCVVMFVASSAGFIALWEWLLRDFVLGFFAWVW